MLSIIILLAILLIALGLAAVFFLGMYLFNKREGTRGEDTIEALDRRLAAGEIRKDEHERLSNLERSRDTVVKQSAGDEER